MSERVIEKIYYKERNKNILAKEVINLSINYRNDTYQGLALI
jgi:hypothetical protein